MRSALLTPPPLPAIQQFVASNLTGPVALQGKACSSLLMQLNA